jgi:glycosyltransferase involved in cell wall biosynthesis
VTGNARYSVILPVRNGGEYVKECINSILAQTLQEFNVLVLDNYSTDGTAEWIGSLQDNRITIYRSAKPLTMEENWGRIKDISKNEFMTMIGHDDYLHPQYLQIMDDLIKKHPSAGLYQTHFHYIDSGGQFLRPCLPMDEVQYGHEFLACHMARTMDSMGTGYMMRSSDYNMLGGMPAHYPNLLFADYELWIRLSGLNYKATSPETGFSYRIHQSVSRTTNGVRYQEAFLQYTAFIKELQDKGEHYRQVIARYGNDMLLYHCESLSHRLLKTPLNNRPWRVSDFIGKCKEAANQLGFNDVFRPEQVKRIKLATIIDNNAISRYGFYLYRKLIPSR